MDKRTFLIGWWKKNVLSVFRKISIYFNCSGTWKLLDQIEICFIIFLLSKIWLLLKFENSNRWRTTQGFFELTMFHFMAKNPEFFILNALKLNNIQNIFSWSSFVHVITNITFILIFACIILTLQNLIFVDTG